jgi:hypothetical protein
MKAAQPEPARPSWHHQHAREVDTGMRTKPTGVDQAHTKGEPLAPSGRHETVDRGAEHPQGADQVRAQDEPLPAQCR